MGWVFLAGAIVAEICGTVALKYSDGLTRWLPVLLVVLFYGTSFAALSQAIRTVELGMAYAIWSGVGTAAIAVIGILYFGEAANFLKVASLALVIIGIVGLRLSGTG